MMIKEQASKKRQEEGKYMTLQNERTERRKDNGEERLIERRRRGGN